MAFLLFPTFYNSNNCHTNCRTGFSDVDEYEYKYDVEIGLFSYTLAYEPAIPAPPPPPHHKKRSYVILFTISCLVNHILSTKSFTDYHPCTCLLTQSLQQRHDPFTPCSFNHFIYYICIASDPLG